MLTKTKPLKKNVRMYNDQSTIVLAKYDTFSPFPIPTYVINLDSDTVRWNRVQSHLRKWKSFLSVFRVSAISEKKNRHCFQWKQEKKQNQSKMSFIETYVLGCPWTLTDVAFAIGKSHLLALQMFLASSDSKFALILEDDVQIVNVQKWGFFLQQLQNSKWMEEIDLLSLGGHLSETSYQLWSFGGGGRGCTTISMNSFWEVPFIWIFNASYLITREGASAILRYFESHAITTHIDVLFHHLGNKQIVRLGCTRSQIFQHVYNREGSSNRLHHFPPFLSPYLSQTFPSLDHVMSTHMFQLGDRHLSVSLYILFWGMFLCCLPPRSSILLLFLGYHLFSFLYARQHDSWWNAFFVFQTWTLLFTPSTRKQWFLFWVTLMIFSIYFYSSFFFFSIST